MNSSTATQNIIIALAIVDIEIDVKINTLPLFLINNINFDVSVVNTIIMAPGVDQPQGPFWHSPMRVDPRKLEYGSGTFYGGVPSFLGFGYGG